MMHINIRDLCARDANKKIYTSQTCKDNTYGIINVKHLHSSRNPAC